MIANIIKYISIGLAVCFALSFLLFIAGTAYYVRPHEYYVDIASPYIFVRFTSGARTICALKPDNDFQPILPFDIPEFNYNNDFIIAKQKLENEAFWIINRKERQLYGPLTRDEYLSKRAQLCLQEDFVLKYYTAFEPQIKDPQITEKALDMYYEKFCPEAYQEAKERERLQSVNKPCTAVD